MATENNQPTDPAAAAAPAISSCRKKKSEQATFLEDVKDHIDEFINASMDEHKSCFKNTVQKVSFKSSASIPNYLYTLLYLLFNFIATFFLC